MPRKVIIRRDNFNSAVHQIEAMVKEDWRDFFMQHEEDLEDLCDIIVTEAKRLVPVDTGKLQNSINARVSGSHRYPGLIVSASARAKYNRGFDYALIQEQNEEFEHEVGQAHYLRDAFLGAVGDFYEDYGMERPTEDDFEEDYIPYGDEYYGGAT